MIFPLIFGIAGIAVLLWLGFWQLQRMEWKNAALAEIDARISAPAVPLPLNPNKADHNRLSVEVELLLSTDELHVLTSQKNKGPGFLIIRTGLLVGTDRLIMVDFGLSLIHI